MQKADPSKELTLLQNQWSRNKEWFQSKIHQLYLSLEYFLLNAQEDSISRTQNCLLLHTGKLFQELVYTTLKKHNNNVKYQVSKSLPGNPRFPAEPVLPLQLMCL